MIEKKTHFKVILAGMTHIGDQPDILFGNYVESFFWTTFNLPDNVDPEEPAVIQCRTYNNQSSGKQFLFNLEELGNILEPHPNNEKEWMMDISVIPTGWLKPGVNGIHILVPYKDGNQDDFVIDNIVLWYKTSEQFPVLFELEKARLDLKSFYEYTRNIERDIKKIK